MIRFISVLIGALLLSGSAARAEEPAYALDVSAREIAPGKVELTIKTNIPLPVEVMASVNLSGQKDTDAYIGYSQRVRLEQPVTKFTLDTSAANEQRGLPAGDYDAEVAFYNLWGPKGGNPEAKLVPDMLGRQPLSLGATGVSAETVRLRNLKQQWVIEHVPMNVPWDEQSFVAKLGNFERYPSDLSHLHDAYYFPDADMTLLVNRLRGEVTIWRMGRETK